MKRPKEVRTCELCGRVGTRCWRRNTDGRTVCRNQSGCVQRLCDKLFREPKQPPFHLTTLDQVGQARIRFWDANMREIK